MKNPVLVLAILALCLGFPGPAAAFLGFGVANDWQATRAHQPLPSLHFVVPEGDLTRICRTHPAAATYGCAVRVPEDNVCLIYTAANPPRWLMEHEKRHCDGWDHGPTPSRQEAADRINPSHESMYAS